MISNKSLFLSVARDAIAEEILKPMGLNPPRIPIVIDDLRASFFGFEAGNTKFPDGGPPSRIAIATLSFKRAKPSEIAGTLAHEMIHSALPFKSDPQLGEDDDGHGPTFHHYRMLAGLTDGPPQMANYGPRFAAWFKHSLAPKLKAAGVTVIDEPEEKDALPPDINPAIINLFTQLAEMERGHR